MVSMTMVSPASFFAVGPLTFFLFSSIGVMVFRAVVMDMVPPVFTTMRVVVCLIVDFSPVFVSVMIVTVRMVRSERWVSSRLNLL